MKTQATPDNSRYIPFTQQPSCCVPTSIQMIMYRNDIPLIPAEELGWHLGLTVKPERENLFYKARVSDTPPPSGYGTQIYNSEYEPNKIFKKLGIPLTFEFKPVSGFSDDKQLADFISKIEAEDMDALLCFNHGALVDNPEKDWGHVCVFDRVLNDEIRIVDASPEHPKWRNVKISKMFGAMQKHGVAKSAGVWVFRKEKNG